MKQHSIGVNPSEETIKIGPIAIRFLITGDDSNSSVSVFEFQVPFGQKLQAPAHKNDAYEENHSNQSGVILLENGLDAFVGRVLLARLAEGTIDVQYNMFHQDPVGRLLIDQKRRCGRCWSNDQEAAFQEKESRTGMITGDQRLISDHLTELWSNTWIRTMITSGSISPMAQTSCTRLIERQARERNE